MPLLWPAPCRYARCREIKITSIGASLHALSGGMLDQLVAVPAMKEKR